MAKEAYSRNVKDDSQEPADPKPSYLQPNSKKHKEELAKADKHVEKVVEGKVTHRKQSLGGKLKDAMIGDDVEEVKSYLLWDVFIPAVKDTVVDLIKKGTDAVFYGGSSKPSNVRRSGGSSYVSYNSYSDWRRNDKQFNPRQPRQANRRAMHRFDDILFEDRRDAEEVLSQLVELTMSYGMASVADFYELAGEDSQFTDNKYGWMELADAKVQRARDGYFLDLPKPEPID